MTMGKTLLLTIVLAAAPFSISSAVAQGQHANVTDTATQQHDRATSDRTRVDQRDMRDRTATDQVARDRDMRDRHMRDGDRRHMRHYGWRRGHHYGWRHCEMRWHHHRRVRVCR